MAQKFFSQGLNSNISQYYDKQLSQANAWESDRMIKTYKTQKIVVKMTRVGKKKESNHVLIVNWEVMNRRLMQFELGLDIMEIC